MRIVAIALTDAQPFIHFWSRTEEAEGVDSWDPDVEPQRFASTLGRTVLELYVRLRREGVAAAIGEKSDRRPDVVVASAPSVWRDKDAVKRLLAATATARRGYVLIRSDVPGWWHLPVAPVVEVMPNRIVARKPNQLFIPELPQRGLIPRASTAIERITSIAVKCNPENLPDVLRDPAFAGEVRAAGVTLLIDVPRETSGPDQQWHDYSNVDAALCARRKSPSSLLWKPAGKLVNSWVAGCIPIAAREPAYLELGRHGEDVWFIDSVGDLPRALRALNGSIDTIRRLEEGVRARQQEFQYHRVLAQWRSLLESAAAAAPRGLGFDGDSPARSSCPPLSTSVWNLRAFHHGARVRNRIWGARDELLARRRLRALG